jgi:hypothetical protein
LRWQTGESNEIESRDLARLESISPSSINIKSVLAKITNDIHVSIALVVFAAPI